MLSSSPSAPVPAMPRLSRVCGLLVLAALILVGCADIEVRGRVAPPIELDGSAVDDAVDQPGSADGISDETADALKDGIADGPHDLAFVDRDEATPTPATPGTATPLHLVSFGSDNVEFGYATPLTVQAGQRIGFTSKDWSPGASIDVEISPGGNDLGSFTATSAGTIFGFLEIPTDFALAEAEIRWTEDSALAKVDSIAIAINAPANSVVCAKLEELNSANAEIADFLAGNSINTNEDPLIWWPQYQAHVRAAGPAIDALRQSFADIAQLAEEPLASDIRAADEDDRALLTGLLDITQESADIAEFESRLAIYQSDPQVVALEKNHRIFLVDAFTKRECGFAMDNFTN